MAEKKKRRNSPEVSTRATNKYARAHYDKFLITVPSGVKEQLRAYAEKAGAKSLNAWITELLERETGIPIVLHGDFPGNQKKESEDGAD